MQKKSKINEYYGVAKGAFKATRRSGWRSCLVSLGDEYVVCEFANGYKHFVPLEWISSVWVESHRVGLGKKSVLVIKYDNASGSRRNIWLSVQEPYLWKDRIIDLCLPTYDSEDIMAVACLLSTCSAELLNYLWENRHAVIDELVEVVGASCHMEVITLIKKEINPLLEEKVGRALIEFAGLRHDPITGEVVTHSWWFMGQSAPQTITTPKSVDVIDEGDYIRVIIEPVNMEDKDLSIGLIEDKLLVSCGVSGEKEDEIVQLPSSINWGEISHIINNGVLDIHVRKT